MNQREGQTTVTQYKYKLKSITVPGMGVRYTKIINSHRSDIIIKALFIYI